MTSPQTGRPRPAQLGVGDKQSRSGKTAEAHARPEHTLSERDWQSRVVEFAQLREWMVYHPWTSIHSAAGWPDLTMARRDRLVVAELKSDKGRVSPAQMVWLDALRTAGAETYIWRPAVWDDVMRVLS